MKALLAIGVLLALAAPASAAEVVRVQGAALDVADRGRDLCARVTLEPEGYTSRGCSLAPARAASTLATSMADDDTVFVGGATPAAVTRVEAEGEGGVRGAADTVAGPRYRGRHAGRLRFFLIAVPRNGGPDEGIVLLRAYGPDGALLGAVQPEYRDDVFVAGPEPVLAERGRGRAIVVTGHAARVFAPTPLALDRFEIQPCLNVRARSGGSEHQGATCRDLGPFQPQRLVVEDGCGPLRSLLYGFVGPGVEAVRVRLGSGRVLTVPARSLASYPGARYVAVALPRGEAVRSAGEQRLGAPPGGLPCVPDDGAFGFGLSGAGDDAPRPESPGDQVAVEAGGHRLVVRDAENERLCVNVDALNADASDCGLPPVDVRFAWFPWRGRHFGGAVPPDIARVRLPGGRELATVAGAGYTGRYAGALRFVLGETPAKAGWATLLAADGTRLGRAYVGAAAGFRAPRKVALKQGKGWTLTGQRFEGGACLNLVDDECFVTDGGSVMVAATCAPRRALLFGVGGRVAVVLKGGRVLRPGIVRVPRRYGGGRVFVIALPRRAEVVAVRRGGKRFTFPVRPARAQCGYRIYESVH